MENVSELLKEVNDKIKALDTAKELYGEQLASDFRVFDYIDTRENGISWVIADLLNPKGNHGQKTLFLRKFIEVCLPNIHTHEDWKDYLETQLAKTQVETEVKTWANKASRRMDIYLSATDGANSYGICIENKPYAGDQENQLTDYFKELENRKLSHKHLIYLSQGEPSEYSVKSEMLKQWQADKVISLVKYNQLVDWLTDCKKDCQNASVTEFLNQFIKFIQKQFMGVEDVSETNIVLESMLSSKDNVANALKISLSTDQMKHQLIQKLQNDLISLISQQNKPYTFEKTELQGKKWEQLVFKIPSSQLTVCFEFGGSAYNLPALGIFLPNEHLKPSDNLYQQITEACQVTISGKNVKAGGAWCAWYYFEPRNWWSETLAWEMIYTSEMAKKIIAEVDVFYQILKENNLLTS